MKSLVVIYCSVEPHYPNRENKIISIKGKFTQPTDNFLRSNDNRCVWDMRNMEKATKEKKGSWLGSEGGDTANPRVNLSLSRLPACLVNRRPDFLAVATYPLASPGLIMLEDV